MADLTNVQTQNVSKEKYQGTGRITSAFGGWIVGGFLGTLAAVPVVLIGGGVSLLKNGFKAKTFESPGVGLVITASIASLLPTIGSIVGAVKNWNKASKGQKQFEESQQKLALSEQHIGHLSEQQQFAASIAQQQAEYLQRAVEVEAEGRAAEKHVHTPKQHPDAAVSESDLEAALTHIADASHEKPASHVEKHAPKEHHDSFAAKIHAERGGHEGPVHEKVTHEKPQHETHAAAIQAEQAQGTQATVGM